MAHRQLTFVHRQFMARMLAEGRSRAEIAEVLGPSQFFCLKVGAYLSNASYY